MKEQFIIDEKGRKTAIVLSIKDYEALLEDLHDLRVVAERLEEDALSLDEVKAKLRADGLIET
jgi:hypothetical protein